MDKRSIGEKDSQTIYEEIQKAQNAGGKPCFNMKAKQEVQVQILPDPKMSPGSFKIQDYQNRVYLAHPNTIMAIRRDIFVTEHDFEDFEEIYTCKSCHFTLDLQFWTCCPVCNAPFDLKK